MSCCDPNSMTQSKAVEITRMAQQLELNREKSEKYSSTSLIVFKKKSPTDFIQFGQPTY